MENIIRQESMVKKRPTAAVLSNALQSRKYETNEEKNLIEATLEGKNRDIVAIVKDEQLRRIWLSCFYQRSMISKAAINKINLEEVMDKIRNIQQRLSMQHTATLLAGLGEILMKKYNLTQNEVKNLLQTILDPADKPDEEQKQKRRRSGSPRRKGQANRAENKAISTYKLLDLSMLLIPQDNISSSFGGKSSVSSREFGVAMSADGQVIHRDEALLSDMEHSYQHLHHDLGSGDGQIIGDGKSSGHGTSVNLRNITSPADAIGSIGKRMLLQENSSSNQYKNIGDMGAINEEGYNGMNEDMMNEYFDPLNSDQHPINLQEVEMETPEIDFDAYLNILKSDSSKSGTNEAFIRKPRLLNDLLSVDS